MNIDSGRGKGVKINIYGKKLKVVEARATLCGKKEGLSLR